MQYVYQNASNTSEHCKHLRQQLPHLNPQWFGLGTDAGWDRYKNITVVMSLTSWVVSIPITVVTVMGNGKCCILSVGFLGSDMYREKTGIGLVEKDFTRIIN